MAKLSDLPKIVEKAIRSKTVLEAVGKSIERSVRRRTKTGKGVRNNLDSPHPLPRLKEKTVANRKQLKRKGKLTGQGATPRKSNLTQTGKMLDNIESIPFRGGVEIRLKDRSERNKAADLQKLDRDYTFMRVSKQEFTRAVSSATSLIAQILRRIRFDDIE